jgi:hypothetical protein
VPGVFDRVDDERAEQRGDLVAGERGSDRLLARSVAAVTVRKARASMARVVQRYQECR